MISSLEKAANAVEIEVRLFPAKVLKSVLVPQRFSFAFPDQLGLHSIARLGATSGANVPSGIAFARPCNTIVRRQT